MHQPDATAPPLDEATAEPTWQPLPTRSRLVFLVGTVPGFALIGLVTGSLMGGIGNGWAAPLGGGATGLLIGALFGLWLGLKQYRYTFWRLDSDGLAVRRGRLWQRETRVPTTRVQHLDIKRGPLQRGRELATLIVHTAGTRHSAVTIPNLDAADAERLRDTLSVQIDHDHEA
ncbi:MAG: PH domain-containing protein [Pseudomonadota bacterium]|nr:PH domain-containing protein [Pseudomonadota bacterium]